MTISILFVTVQYLYKESFDMIAHSLNARVAYFIISQ